MTRQQYDEEIVQELIVAITKRYHHQLYAVAYKAVSDIMLAEDIVQIVFLQLIRKLAIKYDPIQHSVSVGYSSFPCLPGDITSVLDNGECHGVLYSWLIKTCKRTIYTELKKKYRTHESSSLSDDLAVSINPEDMVLAREFQNTLLTALSRLTSAQRIALTLHHLHGCSYEEIADMMGASSAGTIRARAFRGLEMLRNILPEITDTLFTILLLITMIQVLYLRINSVRNYPFC